MKKKDKEKVSKGENLATARPDLTAQRDEHSPKAPQDYTAGSDAKVWWKSECVFSWEAKESDATRGDGDPYLASKLPIPGKNDLATVRPDLAALWNDEINSKTPRDYTVQSHAVVWWKSSTGLAFRARICDMAKKTCDPYLRGHLTEKTEDKKKDTPVED